MNCLLKLLGFKNHDSSLNRDLIRDEKRKWNSPTDKFYYWWFFHT